MVLTCASVRSMSSLADASSVHYLCGMKTFLYIFLATAFLCLGVSCKKNEKSSRMIHTISGKLQTPGISPSYGGDTKYFSYTFSYDKQNRVDRLVYEGELQVYGIGLTKGKYTFDVSYKENSPEVTLTSVIKWEYPEEDRPLEDAVEKLPLVFDNNGMISSVNGKERWFYVPEVSFGYGSDGSLATIREDDGAYYKTQISHQWAAGNIISLTNASLGYDGNVSYSMTRQFTYSNTPNNEFIDLNWLTGNLGLEFQNGITPLALIGLLGNRTTNLIAGSTEYDGTIAEISYEVNEDGEVEKIAHQTLGADYTFNLTYY